MLAEDVGSGGAVIGIDKSESLIVEARIRGTDIDAADFHVGDATALEFADDAVDACRADRVLQHLQRPRAALGEMCRVTRPGGRIAISDPNWDTFIIHAQPADEGVTQQITDSTRSDAQPPTIGHRRYPLIRRAGLTDIEIDPVTLMFTDFETVKEAFYLDDRLEVTQEANVQPPAQAERWIEGMHRAAADDMFVSSVTGFTVAGTVPPG